MRRWTVVTALGELTADVLESTGRALGDALGWLRDRLVGIPMVGPAVGAIPPWLAGIVRGALELLAAIVKGSLGIAGGIIAGAARVIAGAVGGAPARGSRWMARAGADVAAPAGGAVLAVVGKAISLVQSAVALEWRQRPLTSSEITTLRGVFRDSVSLYPVRLVLGKGGVFGINPRPFTLGNTIYLKGVDPARDPATLVHECAHVWQNQHEGFRYMAEALWAQATVRPSAYDWEGEASRGRTRWRDFNKEAQAALVEDVFSSGPDGLSAVQREAMSDLWRRRPLRLSR